MPKREEDRKFAEALRVQAREFSDANRLASLSALEINSLIRGGYAGNTATSIFADLLSPKCYRGDSPELKPFDVTLALKAREVFPKTGYRSPSELAMTSQLIRAMDRFAEELRGFNRLSRDRLAVLYETCLEFSRAIPAKSSYQGLIPTAA